MAMHERNPQLGTRSISRHKSTSGQRAKNPVFDVDQFYSLSPIDALTPKEDRE